MNARTIGELMRLWKKISAGKMGSWREMERMVRTDALRTTTPRTHSRNKRCGFESAGVMSASPIVPALSFHERPQDTACNHPSHSCCHAPKDARSFADGAQVERLVERFLQQQQRIQQLSDENTSLTSQLMEMGNKAHDTLVIHVSPELW